ncbi:MAG TPA: 30S ribosomal protein S20 [Vicinamibacteria bacterium]
MAHSRSAEKRIRQNEKHRLRNRSDLSRLRTNIKKLRKTVEDKDAQKARQLLPSTTALIDRMVKKGVIHGNTGSRYKSRLAKLVTAAS